MKKILSLGLAAAMAVSAMPMAFAADTADYTAGTQVTYTANADANREYSITVPALLNPGQSGTVTLKGMWASNETVKVTSDATVELVNSITGADEKVLDVTFLGIEKAGDNTAEKTYTEAVSVAAMPASALFGTWSGKFNYNVEFVEQVEMITFTVEGVEYQVEKGMTWGEWIENEQPDYWVIKDNYIALYHSGDPLYNLNSSEGIVFLVDEIVAAEYGILRD